MAVSRAMSVYCADHTQCYSEESSLRDSEPPFSGKIVSQQNTPRSAIAYERRNIAAGATAMQIRTYTVLALIVFSSAAFAWQPLTYPVRSQGPYQRSIDDATCFAAAGRESKVNITREAQIPPRKAPATRASSTGAPSRPPLPPSTFSATPPGASMPSAATAPGASAPAATNATTMAAASGASAPNAASATPASTATAATAASGAAGSGTAETTAEASGVKLPPLPAPEPPMTRYWAAFATCMQARGYVVVQ
jgi:hypothetical protein